MNSVNWIDLATTVPEQDVQADICIIGAGAAGIYLAVQLARQGKSVVLLEAGPIKAVDANSIDFSPVFEAEDYPGATMGRYFGMGGSTTRWGGALVPHTSHDLRENSTHQVWDVIVDRVKINTPEVLQQLGYRGNVDFDEYAKQKLGSIAEILTQAGLDAQASLMLPFTRKNLLGLLPIAAQFKTRPRVFFNAVAKDWLPQAGHRGNTRIAQLVAISRNQNRMTVMAGKYILAAGAIESARILLEINQSASQPVLRKGSAPGCFLADHLSLSIADVVSNDSEKTANLFAYHFEKNWMRGIRLLEHNPTSKTPRAFAHFIFSMESAGFVLAKEILGAIQERRSPVLSTKGVITGLSDLMKLAYHQHVISRLYIPKNNPIHLQLDMEQHPIRENRITLSPLRDNYGRQKANINWRISDNDMTSLTEISERLLKQWPSNAAGLPNLIPREISKDSSKPHDAYHPVGTCRMGEDDEAVVDLNLKVWGLENVWIVSTGVLPSAGTANPTFSMLCLAQWLTNHFCST